jgi:hypothetical protein
VDPAAIRLFNAARRLYLPGSYPEVAEDSFEFWTIVDEERRIIMQSLLAVHDHDAISHLHNLSVLTTTPTAQLNDTSSENSSGSESGGHNDASDSLEQKPESELDSAENGADDRASK